MRTEVHISSKHESCSNLLLAMKFIKACSRSVQGSMPRVV